MKITGSGYIKEEAMAIPHEGIVARIEQHVKQLEGMAHSMNRDLAIKLVGHIEEGVACAGIGNQWAKRMQAAFKMVSTRPPEPDEAKVPSFVNEADAPPAPEVPEEEAAEAKPVPGEVLLPPTPTVPPAPTVEE